MPISKKYFQDKVILLLLTLNLFLVFLTTIIISLRLTNNLGEGYIVQYRSNVGIGAFKTGSVLDFWYFVIFAVLIVAFNILLSMKTYRIRRQFSIAIMGMSILLLIIALIVSNALLVLR
jgi:hypothetical protein